LREASVEDIYAPVAAYRRVARGVGLPETGGRLTQPGGRPVPGARTPGGV